MWEWTSRAATKDDLVGVVGETSPWNSPCKEGDNSTKPELNHVQSTTWETCSFGIPDPGPLNQNH